LNLEPPEHEALALTTRPRPSVHIYIFSSVSYHPFIIIIIGNNNDDIIITVTALGLFRPLFLGYPSIYIDTAASSFGFQLFFPIVLVISFNRFPFLSDVFITFVISHSAACDRYYEPRFCHLALYPQKKTVKA
jgi:hypothetical protein